jgi:uncharacterized protein (DUF433 family)
MDWSQCQAVSHCDADWCFAGTQLPVKVLFAYLDLGSSIDEFLESFPDISRKQIHQVLAFAESSLEPAV